MKAFVFLLLAFIGWMLCGSIMMLGRLVLSAETTSLIHAVLVPFIFYFLARIYFSKYKSSSPILTALMFLSFIMGMDFFVVAMFLEKSFEMFNSFIGTWLPFMLIFCSVWLAGRDGTKYK